MKIASRVAPVKVSVPQVFILESQTGGIRSRGGKRSYDSPRSIQLIYGRRIITGMPEIGSIKDPLLKDLILKILDKKSDKRFKGPDSIKGHPWF